MKRNKRRGNEHFQRARWLVTLEDIRTQERAESFSFFQSIAVAGHRSIAAIVHVLDYT